MSSCPHIAIAEADIDCGVNEQQRASFDMLCVMIVDMTVDVDWLWVQVQNLSGGELQRVALTLCLGKPADVYLIDEPSAYLDSEQRLHAAKVIKRSVARLLNVDVAWDG